MTPTTPEHLSPDRLNRATLARQHLLAQARLDPVDAIEEIGGLQAQEAASPYIALWTRLEDFAPAELDRAFHERTAVKATLMRITLHVTSARDYVPLLTAILPMLRAAGSTARGASARPAGVAELAAATAAFAAVPRRNVELRDFIVQRAGIERLDTPLWWWIRRYLPLVHVPDGVPWAFSRRPVLTTSSAWLGDPRLADGEGVPPAVGVEHLVRRYLGAFGPATVADIGAWSGASTSPFRPALAALEESGIVRRFTDDTGRLLYDLAAAPRPSGDVPAPPRFLPMWDSLLLAHADRTRIISDAHRALVIARNGDVLPSFLVDGRVAGLWWAESAGSATRIVLEPFEPLPPAPRRALEQEGERLAAFLAPREPGAFGRYRRTRARRMPVADAGR